MRHVCLLTLFSMVGVAQGPPANLDFEQGEVGKTPPGWFAPSLLQQAGYTQVLTKEGCRTGGCALLTTPETRPENTFGNLMNSMPGAPYRGKRFVFRAAVRVEGEGRGQLWVRVDRSGAKMGYFENMDDRPVTAGGWAFYEIRGMVDRDAARFNYGVMANESVKVWVDDASLEFSDPPAEGPEAAAARKEISQSYGKMDSLIAAGNFNGLLAFSTSDAMVISRGKRQPLPEAVRAMEQAAGAMVFRSSQTKIDWIEVNGDEAKVFNTSTSYREWQGQRLGNESSSEDLWVRRDGVWRLRETRNRPGRPLPDPAVAKAVVAELKKRVVPLETVEAGKPSGDLAAFGKAVGEARVVALGEATHGTREIFQMKHRMLEYLVKEKGFTVFAIEANWPESEALDRYIKTGEGDPKAGLAAMYFWTWQTEEILAMVEWMRAYNQAPGKHPILSFTSFDMQIYKGASQKVWAYLQQYGGTEAEAVTAEYVKLAKLNQREAGTAAAGAERVVSWLAERKQPLEAASSAQAYREALQSARIVAQATKLQAPGTGVGYRDEMMARNVEWLMKEAYPGEKLVLWAHNGHVGKVKGYGYEPMGKWLRQSLGERLYVLGFGIHTGSVRAMTREGGKSIGLAESKIPAADADSGTGLFSAVGQPLFFLDIRAQDGALGNWLGQEHKFRSCGALWDRDEAENYLGSESLGKAYDGYVYLEKTEAARGIRR